MKQYPPKEEGITVEGANNHPQNHDKDREKRFFPQEQDYCKEARAYAGS